ncbi:hypothetical protein ASZ90_020106 [hydrocarbon metagenome]|uniref:Uncharacterized protein n=1 Tax=hydrocarbon metagenome TaxID=938273 RepID=A0A0W8E1H4_9ZZZZ
MKDSKIFKQLILLSFLSISLFSHPWAAVAEQQPVVYSMRVEDTVTAGTAEYLLRGINEAESYGAQAVIIFLNTPGGLVTATLDIIQGIDAAEIPVITYVTPRGGIAASAGTFILISGHYAAMSPGTTCGAAMPVSVGAIGEKTEVADQKTINFLAGHMKSIAREKGRPADIAEKFVTENLTLTAEEALDQGVIDLIADDTLEMLNKLNGTAVEIRRGTIILDTSNVRVEEIPMNVNEKLINILSDPALAALFIMLGIYGLIIGFSSPGYFLPEVAGSIFLIMGLYGVGLFQVNIAAVLLLVLGMGLLVAEAFTPTHGILGTGGVIGLVLGILLFPLEPLMPEAWFLKLKILAVGAGTIGGILLIIIVIGIMRLRRLKPMQDDHRFLDYGSAYVVRDLNPYGQVKIRGEIWSAKSKSGGTIEAGQKVKVTEREGITLIVESAD